MFSHNYDYPAPTLKGTTVYLLGGKMAEGWHWRFTSLNYNLRVLGVLHAFTKLLHDVLFSHKDNFTVCVYTYTTLRSNSYCESNFIFSVAWRKGKFCWLWEVWGWCTYFYHTFRELKLFVAICTRNRQWSHLWAREMQSPPFHLIFFKFNICVQ